MKPIYILAAALLALASCDKNEDTPIPTGLIADISATIGDNGVTRAGNDKWADGDRIGITVKVGNIPDPHINMEYATDGSEKFTGNPIYFYKPMTLTAYYPFNGDEGTAPGIIEAITDAAGQSEENQPQIDFLWDRQTEIQVVDNAPEVHFQFTHKMSKLTLKFIKGNDGTDVSKIISYSLDGLVLDGTFNPETGVCAVKSEAEVKPLTIDLKDVAVTSDENLRPLILFPQTLRNGKVDLHIYANEVDNEELIQHYSATLDFSEGEIKSGNNYQYKITIEKANIKVEKSSITNWTDTDGGANAESTD